MEGLMEIRGTTEQLTVINAIVANSMFQDVDMSKCRIDNVNLSSVSISDANLAGTSMTNVNLSNVCIEDADVTGMSINGIAVSDMLEAYRASRTNEKNA
jgi:uncharacterized protein YjbI with pentapeptide repeats